ncbi:hypothetical protein FQN49_003794 [Arthroderma sp. PD_2]|nr:hypothetical protein FQN49_003794 [Arthroderma sp. PD_2]
MAGKLPSSDAIKHIHRLIAKWPKDQVRPESVSVQTYLQSRLSPPRPQAETDSSFTSRLTSIFSRSKPQQQPQSPRSLEPPLLSKDNINVLYSLLENRYKAKYPLRQKLRHPASQPDYYDRLLKEFGEAAHRSSFDRLKTKLSGVFRLK